MKRIFTLLTVALILMLTACTAKTEKLPASTADGVVVALIDTGISTAAIDEKCILKGYNYVADSDDTEDRINHGSAVASVIVGCESAKIIGVAPEAKLVPLVVTDKIDGEIKSVAPDTLARAIRDAVDVYGADIINVSLGIKKDTDELRSAVEYADTRGVLVVSAVGNDGEESDYYYPAAYDTVLAVGSCDRDGNISDFSQKNGRTDVYAPGEDVWLASRNGVTYGARGTSYATAYVSAAAANLLAESSEMTTEEIRKEIKAVMFFGVAEK